MIDEFEAIIAAEDAAALADVEKDLTFMAAAGRDDVLAVLALIEKTFDGGEDPRLVAGMNALQRINCRPTDGTAQVKLLCT